MRSRFPGFNDFFGSRFVGCVLTVVSKVWVNRFSKFWNVLTVLPLKLLFLSRSIASHILLYLPLRFDYSYYFPAAKDFWFQFHFYFLKLNTISLSISEWVWLLTTYISWIHWSVGFMIREMYVMLVLKVRATRFPKFCLKLFFGIKKSI